MAQNQVNGNDNNQQRRPNMNWLRRFRYQRNESPHKDMRHVMLIVSALIAGVTFQAGVNSSGRVWQDSSDGHVPGGAIYASHKAPLYTFLVFNTLALFSSIWAMISLTFRFPFCVEIWIAAISLIITYGSFMQSLIPHDGNYKFRYILLTAALPIVVSIVVKRKTLFPDLSDGKSRDCSNRT